MAALAARDRVRPGPAGDPGPQDPDPEDPTASGGTPRAKAQPADYQSVVNVAAGVVTLSAGALGVFGITGGLAIALLRNSPEAVTTASLAAGIGVLLGVASAFLSPRLTAGDHLRVTRLAAGLIVLVVVAALATTGGTFTSRATTTSRAQMLWWLFLGGLAALLLVAAAVVAAKGRGYRLKTLAILTSLTVFGVAVLCVVVLAAGETRTAARPAVATTLDFKPAASATTSSAGSPGGSAASSARGSYTLTVTVKSAGMTSDERYLVAVDRVDRTDNATQRAQVYRTYIGADGSGAVQYTFSLPLAPDSAKPWLGISATLQRADEPGTDPGDHCGFDAGGSPPSGSTCALVYLDPILDGA